MYVHFGWMTASYLIQVCNDASHSADLSSLRGRGAASFPTVLQSSHSWGKMHDGICKVFKRSYIVGCKWENTQRSTGPTQTPCLFDGGGLPGSIVRSYRPCPRAGLHSQKY